MRKQYLFVMLLCATSVINAQEFEPEFSFNLYFETAGGSRDTIELGCSREVASFADTAFGQVIYSSPVSIDKFRVFMSTGPGGGTTEGYDAFLRKRIVGSGYIKVPDDYFYLFNEPSTVMLFPKDSLPITITWNDNPSEYPDFVSHTEIKDGFFKNNDCPMDEPDTNIIIMSSGVPSAFKIKMFDYLPNQDHLTRNSMVMNTSSFYLYLNGQDTFALLSLLFANNLRTVANEKTDISSPLNIYPNPVSDICYIKGGEIVKKVQVYDMSGKCVLSFNGNITRFPCNTLKRGIHAVLIETENSRKSYKLVKK
ncbi:MAG: T9SS type A sorting domain-containing protein [Bacteroidales bacterium]|jgi:hypothetical protein|nr:T9SS type A sorting domain-containing protein [Bacteroidales bacterium]